MLKGVGAISFRKVLCLVLLSASNAVAATVGVGLFQLSPDPVYIKAGQAVYWEEADSDFAPYAISGAWGSFIVPNGIQFQSPGTYPYTAQSIYGGNWGGTVVVSPNSRPQVTILNPTNNSVFVAPANVVVDAEATDPDPDDVWDVEFWLGTEMVGDVYSTPYTTTLTNLPAGSYTLRAIVWDYSNARATNSVNITVINPGPIALSFSGVNSGRFEFKASGLVPGRTNVLESSTNLASAQNWIPLFTNVAESATASFTNTISGQRFFRLIQLQ